MAQCRMFIFGPRKGIGLCLQLPFSLSGGYFLSWSPIDVQSAYKFLFDGHSSKEGFATMAQAVSSSLRPSRFSEGLFEDFIILFKFKRYSENRQYQLTRSVVRRRPPHPDYITDNSKYG